MASELATSGVPTAGELNCSTQVSEPIYISVSIFNVLQVAEEKLKKCGVYYCQTVAEVGLVALCPTHA